MEQQAWKRWLRFSFSVSCVHCSCSEETCHDTPEEAGRSLESVGWLLLEIGPWCPDCKRMLSMRGGRTLEVGDRIKNLVYGTTGRVVCLDKRWGYAEVAMDGRSTPEVHILGQLSKM